LMQETIKIRIILKSTISRIVESPYQYYSLFSV